MLIRDATEADIPALAQLHVAAWNASSSALPKASAITSTSSRNPPPSSTKSTCCASTTAVALDAASSGKSLDASLAKALSHKGQFFGGCFVRFWIAGFLGAWQAQTGAGAEWREML